MKKPNPKNIGNSHKNFAGDEKMNSKSSIEVSLNELKQLEKTLSSLMKSNKELIAQKYLDGF